MRGHVQKSEVHPGMVEYPGINPGIGKQNTGVGRPEAGWATVQFIRQGQGQAHLNRVV